MSRDRLARWFAQTALIWLLVAALMGVWLRWQAWGAPPLVFNFRFLTHAHSHLMFLGWVYNALAALLIVGFLPGQPGRVYVWLWAGLQAGLLGMAVFFPLQGYAAGSITFSTLHMALAGWLGLRLWLDAGKPGFAFTALRWSIVFLLVSSLGPFALGYVMAKGGQATIWYNLAIYFYLHFQYNGWMLFALLAILLRHLPETDGRIGPAIHLLAGGCAATYAVSALWTDPPLPVYLLAGAGVVLQLRGALMLMRVWQAVSWATAWPQTWSRRFAALAFYSFLLKLAVQTQALWPGLGRMVFLNRNWLIGYFHLVFIGVITAALIAVFIQKNWLPTGKQSGPGWWLLVGGYVCTELVLALPGASPAALLGAALAMLAGLVWVVGANRQWIFKGH